MAFRIPPNVKNYYEPITSLKSSNAMRCRICKGNNKDHIVERNDLGTKGLGSHLYYIHWKEFDKLWEAADKAKQSPSISSFVTQKRVGMSTQMDTLVAKFIINKNLCFSVVEDASFLAILEKAFPGQHVPSRKKLSDEIIPTMADKMSQDLSNQMSGQIVALTSDGWQKPSSTPALQSVTVHWVDSKFKRHDYVLAVKPFKSPEHTSVNIRQLVEGALYERGISVDSVVGLVRDDASNMRAFCRQAGIDSFQCVAHLLHLVVTGAFTADKPILEIIKNVRAVVSFLHRSHPAQVLLNEVLSSMNMRVRKIPMDVVIRWNSTFAMLDIFHEQRQALYEFNRRWTREKTKKMPEIPGNNDFILIRHLLDVLRIYDKETKRNFKLSRKTSTCSAILPTLKQILKALDFFSSSLLPAQVLYFVTALKVEVSRRLDVISSNPLLTISWILDPRFNGTLKKNDNQWSQIGGDLAEFAWKWGSGENQAEEGEEDIDQSMRTAGTSAVSNVDDIWSQDEELQEEPRMLTNSEKMNFIDTVKIELAQFRQIRSVLKRDEDLFNWWSGKGDTFPKLFEAARILFAIPATSVSSERVFSGAGPIYGNKQRNRLGGQKAEQLLLLKAGMRKLELAPIVEEADFDEVNELQEDSNSE